MEEYERRFLPRDVLSKDIPQWLKFHDVILEHYQNPLLVVQYEELKSNFVREMEKIRMFFFPFSLWYIANVYIHATTIVHLIAVALVIKVALFKF